MANAPFQRTPGKGKFAYLGVNNHMPPDLVPAARAPFLLNVSPDQTTGAMNARAGLTKIGSTVSACNCAVRVNNSMPGAPTWKRFLGGGGNLYVGQTAFTQIDTGFSGNPMSLIPCSPPQSPETWLYVFDSLKQAKYRTDGVTKQNVGILPPVKAPVTNLVAPNAVPIADVSSTAGWSNSGQAGAVSLFSRVPASTTVAAIVWDVGSTGWVVIAPTNPGGNYSSIGVGSRLNISGVEYCTVQQVFPALASSTVSSIVYEASGNVVIAPSVSVQGLQRNALVKVAGNSARVLSVTEGPDGQYSFKCFLPPGVGAGAAITIPASFRCYTTNSHGVGNGIASSAIQSAFTLAGGATTGTGIVSLSSALDLSAANGRPLTSDDYLHASFFMDNPANVTEVHLMLDVDSSVNDFTHNYYYYVARQSDFQQVATGGLTTTAANLNALANQIANNAEQSNLDVNPAQSPYPAASLGQTSPPFTNQFTVGSGQWFEMTFKINDLTRVGSDASATLRQVKAVAMLVVISGPATVALGSVWAGGSYGPDVNVNSYGNQGQPIVYRYRYRSSLSGAYSDVSPATRNGELPWRQGVTISLVASPDPQVDLIDIERNGGTFDTWGRFMTTPNATGVVTDSVLEEIAAAGDPLELLSYAPWPVTDKPRYGTCSITGTRVTLISGDVFNVNWIRGVEIIVNNQTYTLHAPPESTFVLETEQSIGAFANIAFIIPEATIIGFPLPYVCGPYDGRLFGTGDPYNPGLLYFLNPFTPDCASDQGYIEVTSPSDPLGPPILYEGAVYVQSAQGVFRVDPTPGQANPYAAYKLGSAVGLAATWASCATGPLLAWLGADGIYALGGSGQGANLTQGDIRTLFPFESRPGLPVTVAGFTLFPPDYAQVSKLQLSYADGFLLFDYADTQGAQRTLAYNIATQGWIPYLYSPGITLHYQEEGVQNPVTLALGTDGGVYSLSSATSDNGVAFTCVVAPPADDQGETRARKQYGDLMLDYSGTVTLRVYYDNYLLGSITPATAIRASRGQSFLDLGLDAVSLHRNIGILAQWTSTAGTVLYEWQPSFLPKPEDTVDRPTDWMDAGTIGYKFVHGFRLTADTAGIFRTVQVQYDGGLIGPILTVNHLGELTKPYSFAPFKAHLMRLVPTDPGSWRVMAVEWDVDPEPESATFWVTQPTSFEMPGYLHMRDFQFAYAAVAAGAVLTAIVDGVSYTLSASLPATGGAEVKKYLPSPPAKGKLWQLYCSGQALQIYARDCEFRIKSWGAPAYATLKPFGDASGIGARL